MRSRTSGIHCYYLEVVAKVSGLTSDHPGTWGDFQAGAIFRMSVTIFGDSLCLRLSPVHLHHLNSPFCCLTAGSATHLFIKGSANGAPSPPHGLNTILLLSGLNTFLLLSPLTIFSAFPLPPPYQFHTPPSLTSLPPSILHTLPPSPL